MLSLVFPMGNVDGWNSSFTSNHWRSWSRDTFQPWKCSYIFVKKWFFTSERRISALHISHRVIKRVIRYVQPWSYALFSLKHVWILCLTSNSGLVNSAYIKIFHGHKLGANYCWWVLIEGGRAEWHIRSEPRYANSRFTKIAFLSGVAKFLLIYSPIGTTEKILCRYR